MGFLPQGGMRRNPPATNPGQLSWDAASSDGMNGVHWQQVPMSLLTNHSEWAAASVVALYRER